MSEKVTVTAHVNVPVEKAWSIWTHPYHIINWNHASDDWHTTRASNDIRAGGKFSAYMAAKDGSFGFEFGGEYSIVEPHQKISYAMEDGRMVDVLFESRDDGTFITETFDAEGTNPVDLQRQGWQAILNNYAKYAENFGKGKYSMYIDASPDKVHQIMTDSETYRKWTHAFNPTSHFKGSWEEGSKILFIGCDEEGNEGGMVSRIKANQKGRYISIEHIGEYKNGEEITTGPTVEAWKGALENYTFMPEAAGTRVIVEMTGVMDDFADYFDATWPEALMILKSLCE